MDCFSPSDRFRSFFRSFWTKGLYWLLLSGFLPALIVLSGCDSSGPSNQPPNAEAVLAGGVGPSVNIGTQVQLDATGSSDPNGDQLTYSWTLETPSGSNASLTGADTPQPTFTPDETGVFTAAVEVSDGTATDTAQVEVRVENRAPTAEAGLASGASTPVSVGEQVALDGTGSSDPDGDSLRYDWTLASTPSNSATSISDPSAAQPAFTPDEPGTYTASLEVSDGSATDTDEVSVTAEVDSVVISSSILSDRTLTPDQPYLVTDAIKLKAVLTIEPGTTIEFQEGAGLEILSGRLVSNGTETDSITFTGTEKTRGHWKGLYFEGTQNTHEFDHTVIEYGGHSVFVSIIGETANLTLKGARIDLTNSTVRASSSFGLFDASGGSSSIGAFSDNTFTDNADAPIYFGAEQIGAFDAASSYTGNDGPDAVRLDNTKINDDATVSALGVPYRVDGNGPVGVRDGASVTVEAGATLAFEEGGGVYVLNGTLVSSGTDADSVRFTGTEAAKGHWKGIYFEGTQNTHELDHTIVEYGGHSVFVSIISETANLTLRDASLRLTNSAVRQSAENGVFCSGNGTLDASNTTFSGNATQNIDDC